MHICSYLLKNGEASYGVLDGDHIKDAGEAFRAQYATLRDVLAGYGLEALRDTPGHMIDVASVTMLSPIPQPDKIICIGLNYMGHIRETGRDKPEYPMIFTRFPDSVLGHGGTLLRPKASERFDFEGELAVIIGKPARHVTSAEAMKHVAGYSCFNDGSIRDYQGHTTQFWPGKNFEGSGAMGPAFVTTDEVPDLGALQLETRLNGVQVQSGPISDLAFDVPHLIAYLSSIITLLPGDVIATGTPAGVGAVRTPPLWMKAGDTVEVEITTLGTLRNDIADEG